MKNKLINKKTLSILLTLIIVFGMFAAVPNMVYAADGVSLVTTINDFDPGGTGKLTATVYGSTITVTGTVTGASNILNLDIDSGLTVVWQANYAGAFPDFIVIALSGDGLFTVVTDASVINTAPTGIAVFTSGNITVNGGTVKAAGIDSLGVFAGVIRAEGDVTVNSGMVLAEEANGWAIDARGNVTVNGGTVSAKNGKAISAAGPSSAVNVTGGTVTATTGFAIFANDTASAVNVSGGTITASGIGGRAVYVEGSSLGVNVSGPDTVVSALSDHGVAILAETSVTVSSGAVVSAATAIAIKVTGLFSNVEVSGADTVVSATTGTAIESIDGNVKINNGMVSSATGKAISARGNVTVFGGEIKVTGDVGNAIEAEGSVTIDGGKVSAAGIDAGGMVAGVIRASGNITVNGGAVSAEADNGWAIVSLGDVTVNNGTISAKDGYAVYADDIASAIKINSGFVFAYGIELAAIIPENFVSPASDGVVVAWDAAEGAAVYTKDSETDLTVWSSGDGASAVWDIVSAASGISYKKNDNTGFFPISGVTVSEDEEPPSDADEESPVIYLPSINNFARVKTYNPGQFADVKTTDWFNNNVTDAYEYGLMQGNSATTFNPTGNITIAEAITIAARVHGIYYTGKENFIPSVPPENWYKVYVDYAIDNDIVKSTDFEDYGKFATRAEMAYIFSRSVPQSEFMPINTVNSLPDVNPATKYNAEIIMLYKAGILAGNDGIGTFEPTTNITRAQSAAIITRVILPAVRLGDRTYSS